MLLWNEIARVCPEGTLFHGVRDFARERGDSRTAGVEKLDRCAKRGEFANASIVGVLWEVSRNHLPASHPRHWANAIEENYMSEQTTAVSYLATVLRRERSGHFTAAEYDEVIQDLLLAKTQLRPDGQNCAVCEDNGHQAWECHHNPLVMALRGVQAENEWRCFHCGFVSTSVVAALEHFGVSSDEVARCLQLNARAADVSTVPVDR